MSGMLANCTLRYYNTRVFDPVHTFVFFTMEDSNTEKKCPSGHSCSSCGGKCSEERQKLHENLLGVKHIILVMSGKGGVGKSTVATNLAMSLSLAGYSTGLLDIDLHGPSIPTMMGIEGQKLMTDGEKLLPVQVGNVKVMSIGLSLASSDQPVIWRGPVKYSVIQQFLSEVAWGELDYLVIDSPPGTGDEPLSVCQLLPQADGAVVVTTPQQVAATDVAKSLNFLQQVNYQVLGIVENMSGFVCPHCGQVTEIFSHGAGEELARKFGVPFLGRIPIDPQICAAGDAGKPFAYFYEKTVTAQKFAAVVDAILAKR